MRGKSGDYSALSTMNDSELRGESEINTSKRFCEFAKVLHSDLSRRDESMT